MPRFLFRHPRSVFVIGLCLALALIGIGRARRTAASGGAVKSAVAKPKVMDAAAQQRIRTAYAQLPLSFEANQGQTDPQVNFIARGPGYNLFLTSSEAVLVLAAPSGDATADQADEAAGADAADTPRTNLERRRATLAQGTPSTPPATVLRMQLLGTNAPPSAVHGDAELPGKVNYIFGSDPSNWRTDVPTYGQVRYEQVYPGVDLVYYGNQQQLEYDFVVAPGADPNVINLNYDGAQAVKVDGDGGLVLKTGAGDLRQLKPFVYQPQEDGAKKQVNGHYVLKGDGRVGFRIGKYDRRKPLVIDPILSYLSYINTGGEGVAIAVDPSGNAYITGILFGSASGFTTPGAYQIAYGGFNDAFVTKINQAGDGVFYTTYLGGSGDDYGNGIAVDTAGNAYIAGGTSGGFPVTPGVYQTTPGGNYDAFIVKLNQTGSGLVFSTLLGGNGTEEADNVAIDAATGDVYVSGLTTSTNLSTTAGAFRSSHAGGYDGYAAKLEATGAALKYLTYVGGGGFDYPVAMTADSDGNMYLAGQTSSINFPTQNAVQAAHANSDQALFKSSNAGSSWSLSRNNMPANSVHTIAVNPASASTIYAGTDGGVYKTTDGGANWSPTAPLNVGRVRQLLIDPTAPNTVYAGTLYGVYKTTDGGNTWVARNNGLTIGFPSLPADVRGLALHPASPNTVYAATFSGIFKSTDGGGNWTASNTGLSTTFCNAQTNGIVVDPTAPNTLYVAIADTQRVFKTTNGGANWTAATAGLPNSNVNALAINPASPATLYAATNVGVYKTTNGGASWSAVNTGLLLPRNDGSTGTNPGINCIAIDPVTPSTLYAAPAATLSSSGSPFSFAAMFKSVDGGANWTALTTGFNNANVSLTSVAVDPVNPANVYAGQSGNSDGFLVKLNPTGSGTLYSTFIGGNRGETAHGVALDALGNVYVAGTTRSLVFPTTAGAFQTTLKGANDLFVTKYNAAGTALVYSTYLGSGDVDNSNGGLAVDTAGNAYVTGITFGTDFPVTPGAFQTTTGDRGGRNADIFVSKLSPAGSALVYSSYLGGGGSEAGFGFLGNRLDLDAFGNAFVLGTTNSANFPAFTRAASPTAGSATGSQTFVAKVSAATPTYSIIGRLTTTSGTPITNQSVEAIAAGSNFSRFATTDSQGYYSLISLPQGDYTVTPNQFGPSGQYSFTPPSRIFNSLSADQVANFTGTPLFYIQGTVTDQATGRPVIGVTVTLSGSASATTQTGPGGSYAFFGLIAGGNYTVTPSRAGYTFTPASRTFNNLSANQFSANFTTPSARFYTVSGRIADVNNVGVAGVLVLLTPENNGAGTGTTDINGNYSIPNVQSDLTYFVVPLKVRRTFTPNIPTIGNLPGPTTVNFTAQAATGLNGKIAFTASTPTGGLHVRVANADGTNVTAVTSGATVFDSEPTWAPDGTKLAFTRFDQSDPNAFDEIYTVNADGSGLVRLTDTPITDEEPSWSPDGTKIAYADGDCSDGDGIPVEIYAVNPDGSGRTRLTNNAQSDSYPAWSPDATKLAFARVLGTDCSGSEADIWTMNADGSGQTQLTSGAENLDFNPVWSPDGTKIAFVREPNTSREQIYVMNADGTGVTNLTPFIENTFTVTWSPDGTKLAFDVSLPSTGNQILVMNADGTGLTSIVDSSIGGFDPVWRPDQSLQPANISGRIADANSVGVAGVTVALAGTQGGTTTTDANGFYAFRNLPRNGNYTVTPTLAGRTFSPAQQSVNNLLGTRAANFSAAALTVQISGRVVNDSTPSAGLAGVTVTLSGSAGGTTITDGNGNYSFTGLAPGGNYTVTPARPNYLFDLPAQTFSNVTANQQANFVATLVYVISGRVTDTATGGGLAGVTITVSGTRTVVTTTDGSGNYAVTVVAGGTYSVTATSPYNLFVPPRADFPNLSGPQTVNFASVLAATPTPTPPLNDNFNTPTRDPEKWNLGTLSQDADAVDPLIPVLQRAGHLEITPLRNASGEHFNGYVSVRPFDFTSGTAAVEVVQTTTSTAQTIFGLGSDSQNNFRFVVTALGAAPAAVRAAFERDGGWGKLAAETLVLVFQVKISGVITQQVIPYDAVAHRFWRFRHQASVNAMLFETSADNQVYTERFRKSLEKGVSALAVELTAGTAQPTTGGGTAVFDNLNIMTSAVAFSGTSFSVTESAGAATVTITRTGGLNGTATVAYATEDNPAPVSCADTQTLPGVALPRCDYTPTAGVLSFAPGETSKSFAVSLLDDTLSEGAESFSLVLRQPSGASLGAPGRVTISIMDDDTALAQGLQYYPLATPIRLLDTRAGETAFHTPGAPISAGTFLSEQGRVSYNGVSIPPSAQALVGNLAVVNTTPAADAGFITLYPAGVTRPTVANINYTPGQVINNAFTVGLSSSGSFNLYAYSTTHVVVDVTGYYAPPAAGGLYYHPLATPVRLLDTRAGEAACDQPGVALGSGSTRLELARGTCGGQLIPAAAQALTGNLAVVNNVAAAGAGYITLYPSGRAQPLAANINYGAGDILNNAFTVGLGADGAFNIFTYTGGAATHLVVDVSGYYSAEAVDANGAGLLYYPLASPLRLLDTRAGEAACDLPGVALASGSTRLEAARGTCAGQTVPVAAQAIVGNLAVVNVATGAGAGYITLYPSGRSQPLVANLNYGAGQVLNNAFTVGLGSSDGAFQIYTYTGGAPTHLVVDVSGFFAP